jgi:hypothetical protein
VYFRISDATRVLDYLRSQDWQLLGLEGFHVDSGLRPDLDRIADLSTATDGIQSAQGILDAWARDVSLLIHFTVRSR